VPAAALASALAPADSAQKSGGAVLLKQSQLLSANDTFLINAARSNGGAIFSGGGRLETMGDVFVNNSAAVGGAEFSYDDSMWSKDDVFVRAFTGRRLRVLR
jgi:hypothetical protein